MEKPAGGALLTRTCTTPPGFVPHQPGLHHASWLCTYTNCACIANPILHTTTPVLSPQLPQTSVVAPYCRCSQHVTCVCTTPTMFAPRNLCLHHVNYIYTTLFSVSTIPHVFEPHHLCLHYIICACITLPVFVPHYLSLHHITGVSTTPSVTVHTKHKNKFTVTATRHVAYF